MLKKYAVVESSLHQENIFADYVSPAFEGDQPVIKLFRVARQENVTWRNHLVMYFDGSLSCDCQEFYQYGFYCKHACAVIATGKVEYQVSLAVDESYSDNKLMIGPAVACGNVPALPITKHWDWATYQLGEVDGQLGHGFGRG